MLWGFVGLFTTPCFRGVAGNAVNASWRILCTARRDSVLTPCTNQLHSHGSHTAVFDQPPRVAGEMRTLYDIAPREQEPSGGLLQVLSGLHSQQAALLSQ